MLSSLKSLFERSSGSTVGLNIQTDGIWVTRTYTKGKRLHLDLCEFLPAKVPEDRRKILKKWVKSHRLAKTPCHCVLNLDDYQLLQVPLPLNVPVAEQINALRWQVQDVLRFPAVDAVLATFEQPEGEKNTGPEKINLVAVPPHAVDMVKDLAAPSKLELNGVNIAELALGQILEQHPDAREGVAMIHYFANSGLIIFMREKKLFFSAHTHTGANGL